MKTRLLIAFVVIDLLLGAAVYRGYQNWSARQDAKAVALEETAFAAELREKGTTLFPEPRPLSRFSLVADSGEEFNNEAFLGRWSLLFFGFTHCPDICPLTMKELAEFYEQLAPAEQSQLQVILGTVDPERDDAATMKEFVGRYNQEFVGITGSRSALSVLTKQLYVVASDPAKLIEHDGHVGDSPPAQTQSHAEHGADMAEETAEAMPGEMTGEMTESTTDYLITHSSHIGIVNPDGKLHGVIRPPHRDRDLLAVVRTLLQSSL